MKPLVIAAGVAAGGALLLAAQRASAASCPGLPAAPSGGLDLVRVQFPDPPGDSYSYWTLRADVAEAARRVVAQMLAVGARPSSGGGLRSLTAEVGPNRSATSLHYIGAALDLWPYGMLVDPARDPYIVTRDGDRLWRVWARCAPGKGQRRGLLAVRSGAPAVTVEADVIDLTELMRCHGLHRISSRREAWDGIERDKSLHGGTEAWHFEAPPPPGARFGDELLRVHPRERVEGTPPWRFRDFVWNGSLFAQGVS